MSKTQLKKEISNLNGEQLTQLLLDVYSKCKDAKIYLDFYCNPDEDKLYRKYSDKIAKEISRGKYGRSMARISKIKGFIKEFSVYGCSVESCINLQIYAAQLIIYYESIMFMRTPLLEGCLQILKDVLECYDRNFMFDKGVEQVKSLLDKKLGSIKFINYLRKNLAIP